MESLECEAAIAETKQAIEQLQAAQRRAEMGGPAVAVETVETWDEAQPDLDRKANDPLTEAYQILLCWRAMAAIDEESGYDRAGAAEGARNAESFQGGRDSQSEEG